MGSVVQLRREIEPVAALGPQPSAAAKAIDQAYAKLARAPGYHHRPEQQGLSHEVAAALIDNIPFISEAPTGSGKTIGYSIGALAAGRELGLPLVIATATVALQGQVMSSDLKRVEATGLVHRGEYRLVRGRGRFFCPVAAAASMERNDTSGGYQAELFDETAEVRAEDLFDAGRLAPALCDALEAGTWDGTRDALPANITLPRASVWSYLSSSPESCLRQSCPHYKGCPFFNARAQWEDAKVLVANHHLVLMDLRAAKEGKTPVFPFKEYILVVDEAHHMPDTALATQQEVFKVGLFVDQLARLELVLRDVYRDPSISAALANKVEANPRATLRILRDLIAHLLQAIAAEGVGETSFDAGGLMSVNREWAPNVRKALEAVWLELLALTGDSQLRKIVLSLPNIAKKFENESARFQVMQSALGALQSQLVSQMNGIGGFLRQGDQVLWLSRQHCGTLDQGWQPVFNSSPLEAKALLADLLWGQTRARVAMVSATVQGTSGFDHFKDQMGLVAPSGEALKPVRTQVLPSRFAYESTPLQRVMMKANPGETGFPEELLSKLPMVINPRGDKGTLVLFTSRKMMRQAYERLRLEFGGLVLCQDTHGGALKVRGLHCEQIDRGMPSILLGVKSLAEGFDLPGHYCTHLVVTQLPFEAPTSPLERARQELYGTEYFTKHILPRTARELKQITGRLLRREDDYGKISVMDNRLWRKSYGPALLDSLPPYQQGKVVTLEPAPATAKVVDLRAAGFAV